MSGAKDGGDMKPFTHKYADKAWIEFEKQPSGGFAPVGVTIIANIPLARDSVGYQAPRAVDLETSAVAYAKKLGVPITFRGES
jgi:hypothetical protein